MVAPQASQTEATGGEAEGRWHPRGEPHRAPQRGQTRTAPWRHSSEARVTSAARRVVPTEHHAGGRGTTATMPRASTISPRWDRGAKGERALRETRAEMARALPWKAGWLGRRSAASGTLVPGGRVGRRGGRGRRGSRCRARRHARMGRSRWRGRARRGRAGRGSASGIHSTSCIHWGSRVFRSRARSGSTTGLDAGEAGRRGGGRVRRARRVRSRGRRPPNTSTSPGWRSSRWRGSRCGSPRAGRGRGSSVARVAPRQAALVAVPGVQKGIRPRAARRVTGPRSTGRKTPW